MKRKKILILYSSIGSGHKMAALAIKEQLDKKRFDSVIINIFDYSTINIEGVSNSLNVQNPIIGSVYDFLWKQDAMAEVTKKTFSIIKSDFKNLIDKINLYSPDAIICTHSFGGLIASEAEKQTKTFAVLTDYDVTPTWLNFKFYHYFVSNQSQKDFLFKKGTPHKNISVTGIPLRKQFENQFGSISHNNKAKFSLLIFAGGMGSNKYIDSTKSFTQEIKKLSYLYNVVVVCGNDASIYRKLNARKNKNLKIYGAVKNIAKLMMKSDIILTKPGGLITSESMALGKPIIFIGQGYGQEKYNAKYIVDNGAGIRSRIGKMTESVGKIVSENSLNKMKKVSIKIGKPDASRKIYSILSKII